MDDLERELDGDTGDKKKFHTGTPGRPPTGEIQVVNEKKPGDIGRQAAKSNQVQKQLWDKEQVLQERLRRLKEKEFK